jgi:hypothetical protein
MGCNCVIVLLVVNCSVALWRNESGLLIVLKSGMPCGNYYKSTILAISRPFVSDSNTYPKISIPYKVLSQLHINTIVVSNKVSGRNYNKR